MANSTHKYWSRAFSKFYESCYKLYNFIRFGYKAEVWLVDMKMAVSKNYFPFEMPLWNGKQKCLDTIISLSDVSILLQYVV